MSQDKRPQIEYLPRLESLRASAPNITREGLVDVIHNVPSDFEESTDHEELGICHIAHMFEGSFLTPDMQRNFILTVGSFEGNVAIALAIEHLNTGNGAIVPQVEGLNKRCNIRFTMESFDNENTSKNVAVEKMIELTDRVPVKERLPCAFIGPYQSRNAIATALLLGIRGYAQMSAVSSSPDLDDKSNYPLFARTATSSKSNAELIIQYLYNELGVKHLAVLHHAEEFGAGYALGLQAAAEKHAADMVIKVVEMAIRSDINDPSVSADVEHSIRLLKETQFTYFFSLAHPRRRHHYLIMEEAFRQGIAGTGKHQWMFSEATGSHITEPVFERNSPLHLAHAGAIRSSPVGGIPGFSPSYDKLEEAFRELKQSQDDLNFLKTVMPQYTTPGHDSSTVFDEILYSDNFLQSAKYPSAFAYDAAIAFGLAACNVTTSESSPPKYFTSQPLYSALVHNTFQGATGNVTLDPSTGSRIAQSTEFEIANNQVDPSRSNETHVAFQLVQTNLFQNNKWIPIHPMIFNDGTTRIPPDLPEITVENNYLTPGLRAGGLIMCLLILWLSLGFAAWALWHKRSNVVKTSQPIFLHMICFGAFILGSSLIPLSIDEGVTSKEGCNRACMAFPWLLTCGFSVVFTALWAKTERINRIINSGTRFRRAVVTAADVYWPMLVILGANVVILSVWTVLAPLELETKVTNRDRFNRPIETYSFCDWSDSVPYYATLGAINLLLLLYAIYVAWRARHISTELSESEYIFKAMTIIALVCFIGVPVTVIAQENPSAFYFVCSSIIFVACSSILLLIFCPKLVAYYQSKTGMQQSFRSSGVPASFRRTHDNSLERQFSANRIISSVKRTEEQKEEAEEDISGVMILNNPKTQHELESEVRRLTREVKRLTTENHRLSGGEGGGVFVAPNQSVPLFEDPQDAEFSS